MDKVQATRRGVLGALSLATLAGGATFAAMPAGAPRDRAAWDAAMIALDRAKRAVEADDKRFNAIHDAYERDKPDYRKIDSRAFPFMDHREVAHSYDLDEYWAKYLAGEGKWWWPGKEPGARDAAIARAKASFDSVRAYRAEREALDQRIGMSAACDRNDRLNDEYTAAIDALIALPAPDGAALLWKLEYVMACGDSGFSAGWSEDFLAGVLTDARRLLSGGPN